MQIDLSAQQHRLHAAAVCTQIILLLCDVTSKKCKPISASELQCCMHIARGSLAMTLQSKILNIRYLNKYLRLCDSRNLSPVRMELIMTAVFLCTSYILVLHLCFAFQFLENIEAVFSFIECSSNEMQILWRAVVIFLNVCNAILKYNRTH